MRHHGDDGVNVGGGSQQTLIKTHPVRRQKGAGALNESLDRGPFTGAPTKRTNGKRAAGEDPGHPREKERCSSAKGEKGPVDADDQIRPYESIQGHAASDRSPRRVAHEPRGDDTQRTEQFSQRGRHARQGELLDRMVPGKGMPGKVGNDDGEVTTEQRSEVTKGVRRCPDSVQ